MLTKIHKNPLSSDKLFLEAFSTSFVENSSDVSNDALAEKYFMLEKEMFHDMQTLDVGQARERLRLIIDALSQLAGKEMIRAARLFYVHLAATMARKLLDSQVPASKAFAFSRACLDVIDNRMSDVLFLQCGEELIEFYVHVLSERTKPQFNHQTVNKVILYINDEIETDLSVEAIAQRFSISTSHLSRIFREHTGITLVEYLNIRKVEESQYFLRHTAKSIADVSDQFHFCNQSYFTRIFKKYTSVTPKQFRDHSETPFFQFSFEESVS